jgi:arylsulfatase A-like enzyme
MSQMSIPAIHQATGCPKALVTTLCCLMISACGSSDSSNAAGGDNDAGTDTIAFECPVEPGAGPAVESTRRGKFHILLILADDLGYGSLNSYGAYREVVRTPNIDRLAARGVRFTNAYSPSSVCSPTRYGILMGRYPWRTELKAGVVNPLDPLWPSTERMNLARWLKARGYRTATIGKWHLGYGSGQHTMEVEEWINSTMPGPEALGFDYSFSIPQNHGDIFGVYFENGKVVGYDDQDQLVGLLSTRRRDYGDTTYGSPFIGFDAPQRVDAEVTERITTRAIEWIQEQVAQSDEPFFLYFAAVAVHEPITPSLEASGTSGAGSYGDFIHDLDGSVGRILDALEAMGIEDDTVVIFTSDNGGEIPGNRNTPQRLAQRNGLAINGALRGDKHTIWEGGTRVPLIARLPGDAQVVGCPVSDALVNLTDIFATIADLVGDGSELPHGVGPDSVSFLPAIQAQGRGSRTSSVTASVNGTIAIRSGDWKWIEGVPSTGFQGVLPADETRPQLYNLRDSPGETEEVSDRHPAIVEQLQRELAAIRESD